MKLPGKEELISERHRDLYNWDTKQWFTSDQKRWECIHYTYRVTRIIDTIQQMVPKGGKILDVACAQGNLSLLLAEKGYEVTGVDIDKNAIDYARRKYEFGKCNFIASDISDLHVSRKFDAIIQGEFLEHVSYPKAVLLHSASLIADKGILVITTPNGSAPHNVKFDSYGKLMAKIESDKNTFHKDGYLYGTREEQHVFAFRCQELQSLLRQSGYEVLIAEYLNSYYINPWNIHRPFPNSIIFKSNHIFSNIPFIRKYSTLSLFAVARKAK